MQFRIKLISWATITSALVLSPKAILAQDVYTGPGAGTNYGAIDNTFSWVDMLWLIPLVLIPVLAYYVFVKKDEGDIRPSWQGTKGGRAKMKSAENKDEQEEDKEKL